MAETLNRSSLRGVDVGSRVNLERAAARQQPPRRTHRPGPRRRHRARDRAHTVEHWEVVRIALPMALSRYVVEKGSITVDGVSLTVSGLGHDWFEVSLIPTTLQLTTLGAGRSRHPGEPRGRHHRQIRRAADGSGGAITAARRWFILERVINGSSPGPAKGGIDDEAGLRRAGGGRHRGGQGRRRHRRRGPRERGRPHLRRREGHPGTGRVHGALHLRLSVRAARRRGLRHARPAADVRGQPGQARHRLHRHRRRERRCRNRHFGIRPGDHHAHARRPDQCRRRLHPARPRGSAARQGRRRAAPPRPHRGRRRPGPAGRPAAGRARSARSSARRTRARWPRPTSCGSSPTSTTWR